MANNLGEVQVNIGVNSKWQVWEDICETTMQKQWMSELALQIEVEWTNSLDLFLVYVADSPRRLIKSI